MFWKSFKSVFGVLFAIFLFLFILLVLLVLPGALIEYFS